MSEVTELIELPPAETAVQVFTDTAKLDEILSLVREKVVGTLYDMGKRKDREACASDAYKVARTKAALAKLRASTSAELKELPKKVDAGGRYLNEGLETIQAQVRAPLDAWEAAEAARIQRHKDAIAGITILVTDCGESAESLRSAIAAVEAISVDESWEEFESEAHRTKDKALASLRASLAHRERYEAEQAELAELRRKQAEQEQKDRDAEIARQAAEKARADAEAKALAEREAAAQREAQAKAAAEQAERDRLEAIERQKQAEARAEAEKLAAEQRAKDAAEAARLAEEKRHADAKAAEEAERRRREADKKHKASINNAAMAAFIKHGLPEDCAKQAVILIAKGVVPAVQIHY